MSFPKMLYSTAAKFADQKALETAVHSAALKTLIVRTAEESEAALAEEWTDDLASLIGRKPGRPKAE